MTRIAHARSLARIIRSTIDSLPYADAQEVERVYPGTLGLVYALNQGWVAQVTEDGMSELVHLADTLLSEDFGYGRALADTVQPGDELELTTYDNQRVRVLVTVRPENKIQGFTVVETSATGDHQPFTENLFWNQCKARRVYTR